MHEKVQEQLKRQMELLEIERKADLEQYMEKVVRLSLSERKEQGVTWHPLQITKSGFTYGERAFLIVEKTIRDQQPHQFKAGKAVRLFGEGAECNGVVNFADRNRIKIILNRRDLPDWLEAGSLGIDLLFDERPYEEMRKAIHAVQKARGDRLSELRDILFGLQAPQFEEGNQPPLPGLNDSQNRAVAQILSARDVSVVHGPPGTGKTTTLVAAVKQLCQREHTVLVCAPSNTATDLLTERLADQGLTVVRVGNLSRVDERIITHTLEAQISQHPESKHIKKVKIEAAEMRRQAGRFRRKFGRSEKDERRHLYRQAGELEAWVKQLEDRLIDQILGGAQVVTSTLIGANHKVLARRRFRTAIIDEAAQALEPATWIPLTKASKLVLAGDPFQLPPTVKSQEAQKGGLGRTLIERCLETIPELNLLQIQYRMHNAIMGFSNQYFYGGKLRAASGIGQRVLGQFPGHPLTFIDTAGCGFEEKLNEESLSRYNPEEFQILCEHLYQLMEPMEVEDTPSIGIISPYREQVSFMEEAIRQDGRLADRSIQVQTIDGFQGQERDVIYISLVRSNAKGEIGFLSDYRRMNVAMTRARKLLVIVGDSATVGGHGFYEALLEYIEGVGNYRTAWEFMQ